MWVGQVSSGLTFTIFTDWKRVCPWCKAILNHDFLIPVPFSSKTRGDGLYIEEEGKDKINILLLQIGILLHLTFSWVSVGVGARKGGCPTNISKRITPTLHQSQSWVYPERQTQKLSSIIQGEYAQSYYFFLQLSIKPYSTNFCLFSNSWPKTKRTRNPPSPPSCFCLLT